MEGKLKSVVKRVPLPLCGVMLATASLGTLLQPYVPAAHPICGVVACVLLALILAKCIIFPELVLADLKIQVTAAVAGTFPMGLMSLSTYLVPYSLAWSFAVWVLALAVYLPLLLNYFIRFIVHGKLDNLTPASFVILVGFVISILTGTKYQLQAFFYRGVLGRACGGVRHCCCGYVALHAQASARNIDAPLAVHLHGATEHDVLVCLGVGVADVR